MDKIIINKTKNADSRTNDSIDLIDLKSDTESHIEDVTSAMMLIVKLLIERAPLHDHTKLENLDEFHKALNSGHIKDTEWYRMHITKERHHLKSYVPDDVNIIDVIEHICDCTMAGLARSGTVYDTDIDQNVLTLAINNTVELLKNHTDVINSDPDLLSERI